ncbi:MAG: guanylate kinase [Oceanococcaceae bacterium]
MNASSPAAVDYGQLLILSAPSGAGKTTLARALARRFAARGQALAFSVSYTTRAPRPGEADGVDYHFIDDATFERMVQDGAFLEHAGVFGRRYGTGRKATEKLLEANDGVVLDIDWQGARQVREQWPQVLSVFVAPPSLEELQRRLESRGQDDAATIAGRMAAAADEIAHAGEFDAQIINADLEEALDALESLMQRPRG